MPPPFPKTAPAAVRLLGSFTLTLLRKNSNTFLLLSLAFFGGKKKKELGAWKRQGRKKDGRLYNLWLSQQTISPLFSVWGGEKGGQHNRESRGDIEGRSSESDALLWLLSYGWRRGASMRAHAHLQQQGVHWASRPFQPGETSSSGGH